MLDLFVRSGYSLAIAHCNFQLRGQESDGDEAFVRQLAEKYQLPLFVKCCPAADYAKEQHISIEMAARDLRYAWFDHLMKSQSFQKLAIGHNRDDDAETFFINLLRNSGINGLKGISVKRETIIRPLMFASRNDILEYAQHQQLEFREDATNATDDYLRNRIRHHILPTLEEQFPGAMNALAGSMEKLKESEKLFNFLLEEKKQAWLEPTERGFRLAKKIILQVPDQEAILYYLLRDFGFSRKVTDQLMAASIKEQTGQQFLSENYVLLSDRDYIFIEKRNNVKEKSWSLTITNAHIEKPIPLNTEIILKDKHFILEKNKSKAYFDLEKLSEPLVLRKWKKGDRFEPFGMKGSKLLSDFFIDEKFSRFDKDNCWLLVSGTTILWVVGYRASRHFSISPTTKKVFVLSIDHKQEDITIKQ